MHVTVDTSEGFNRRMRVEVPEDRIASQVNTKLESLIGNVTIPGFRPGKAPLKLIAHRYGAKARGEVLNELLPETFQEAIEQEKLFPVSEPVFREINADPGKGFSYVAEFDVYPDIRLPALETLEIRRPVVEITDDDVDRMIETLRRQGRTWSVVDRPAASGDRLIVDFEGVVSPKPTEETATLPTLDDVMSPEGETADETAPSETSPSETLKASALPVELGSGTMIPGFEEGLVGAGADDERVLELTYPDEYHKRELAGCPVTFTVRIRSVEEAGPPETDEDFARRFGIEEGTAESIRAATRQDLEHKLAPPLRTKIDRRVVGTLLKEIGELELPQSAVTREASAIAEKKREEFKRIGIDPESLGIGPAKSEPEARQRITISLLIRQLMALSQVKIDPDRVRERVERIAAGYQEPKRMIAWYYEDEKRLAPVESTVLQEQLIDWILERAHVTEERMSFNELLKK